MMLLNRKIILIAVLSVLVIAGILGGVAVANANDDSNAQSEATQSRLSGLYDKVADIYEQNTGVAIDPNELADAFTQALKENRNTAFEQYLANLVEQGKITQEQADEYQQWLDSKPDINISPDFGKDFRRFGGFGKFGQMLRGRCLPETTN